MRRDFCQFYSVINSEFASSQPKKKIRGKSVSLTLLGNDVIARCEFKATLPTRNGSDATMDKKNGQGCMYS